MIVRMANDLPVCGLPMKARISGSLTYSKVRAESESDGRGGGAPTVVLRQAPLQTQLDVHARSALPHLHPMHIPLCGLQVHPTRRAAAETEAADGARRGVDGSKARTKGTAAWLDFATGRSKHERSAYARSRSTSAEAARQQYSNRSLDAGGAAGGTAAEVEK